MISRLAVSLLVYIDCRLIVSLAEVSDSSASELWVALGPSVGQTSGLMSCYVDWPMPYLWWRSVKSLL